MNVGRSAVDPRVRATPWEWAQVALLAVNLGWTTLCLGGYRPETLVVTSGLTCALLGVHFLARFFSPAPADIQPWSWLGVPFLAFAAGNVLFISPVPWLGWFDWLGWANLIAMFWVVVNGLRSSPSRRMVFAMLVALAIGAVALAGYQRFVQPDWLMLGRQQVTQFLGRASGPFGIPNSLAAFLLLLLPAIGALAFRRRATAIARVWWSWVTGVLAFGVFLTVSRGAWIGLALALLAWPLGMTRWTVQRRMVFAAAVLGALVGTGWAIHRWSPFARERFAQLVEQSGELSRPILWRGAWELFREQPIAGTGAGSFNVLFERHRPPLFIDEPQWAHNEYLNTLSDYGVVGFVLFFGAAAFLLAERKREDGALRESRRDVLETPVVIAALKIGLLAFAFQLFVDFHFKIPALAMAAAIAAGLAVGRGVRRDASVPTSGTRPAKRWIWLALSVASVVVAFPLMRLYQAEGLRYRARQALDAHNERRTGELADVVAKAEADFRRAAEWSPRNARAWADLAFALELKMFVEPTRYRELAVAEEAAARRALALSTVVPDFWIRLGVSLDLQKRGAEADAAYAEARRLAPRNSHAWYYYAWHLSRDTKRRDEALRAVATCLSLDPGNAAAEALRAKLNARQ